MISVILHTSTDKTCYEIRSRLSHDSLFFMKEFSIALQVWLMLNLTFATVGYEDGSGSGSGDSEDKDEDTEEDDEEDGSQSLMTFDEELRDHSHKSQTKTVMFTIDTSSSSSKHNHPFVAYVGCQPMTHSTAVFVLILLPSWLIAYLQMTR